MDCRQFPKNIQLFKIVYGISHIESLLYEQHKHSATLPNFRIEHTQNGSLFVYCNDCQQQRSLKLHYSQYSILVEKNPIFKFAYQKIENSSEQQIRSTFILLKSDTYHTHQLIKYRQQIMERIRDLLNKGHNKLYILQKLSKQFGRHLPIFSQIFDEITQETTNEQFLNLQKELQMKGYIIETIFTNQIHFQRPLKPRNSKVKIIKKQQLKSQKQSFLSPNILLMIPPGMQKNCKKFGDKVGFYIIKNAVTEVSEKQNNSEDSQKKQQFLWNFGIFIGIDMFENSVPLGLVIFSDDSMKTFTCIFWSFFTKTNVNPETMVTKYHPNINKSLYLLKNLGYWQGSHLLEQSHLLKKIRRALSRIKDNEDFNDGNERQNQDNMLIKELISLPYEYGQHRAEFDNYNIEDYSFFRKLKVDDGDARFELLLSKQEKADLQFLAQQYKNAMTAMNQQQFISAVQELLRAQRGELERQFLYGFLVNSHQYCLSSMGLNFVGCQTNAQDLFANEWFYKYKNVLKNIDRRHLSSYFTFVRGISLSVFSQNKLNQLEIRQKRLMKQDSDFNRSALYDKILKNYEFKQFQKSMATNSYFRLVTNYIASLRLTVENREQTIPGSTRLRFHKKQKQFVIIEKNIMNTEQFRFIVKKFIAPYQFNNKQNHNKKFTLVCSCGQKFKTKLPCRHELTVLKSSNSISIMPHIDARWLFRKPQEIQLQNESSSDDQEKPIQLKIKQQNNDQGFQLKKRRFYKKEIKQEAQVNEVNIQEKTIQPAIKCEKPRFSKLFEQYKYEQRVKRQAERQNISVEINKIKQEKEDKRKIKISSMLKRPFGGYMTDKLIRKPKNWKLDEEHYPGQFRNENRKLRIKQTVISDQSENSDNDPGLKKYKQILSKKFGSSVNRKASVIDAQVSFSEKKDSYTKKQ